MDPEYSKCRWCGRQKKGNAGDYYHEKACHRRDVIRRMEIEGRTKELERELEKASDTGD
jgi:hypothetical protein